MQTRFNHISSVLTLSVQVAVLPPEENPQNFQDFQVFRFKGIESREE